jgi:hypothetical protein
MTAGGILVMTLSVGGATLFFIFCLFNVLRALGRDKSIKTDIGAGTNQDADDGKGRSDETASK